jgi:hypothetical protein
MTSKEKAIELVYKYKYLVNTWDGYNDEPLEIEYRLPDMKQCALITVDEILQYITKFDYGQGEKTTTYTYDYLQEVKQEIEKL